MGLFRSLAIGVFILALPVALLTANVRFAASEARVYDYSIREYDAATASRIPQSELMRANRELVPYFTADDPGPLRIEVLDNSGNVVSLFNARETAHLADVRDVFQTVFTAQVIALAVVLSLAVLMLVWWPVRALAAAALYGSLSTVAIVGLAGVVALTGFDSTWNQFHVVAFANDFWKLNPSTDHLIQMFPEPFWRDISVLIGALTMLEAMAIGAAGAVYLFISRPREAPEPVPEPRARLPRPPLTQVPPRVPPAHPRHFVH